jgi:hypothetical protein
VIKLGVVPVEIVEPVGVGVVVVGVGVVGVGVTGPGVGVVVVTGVTVALGGGVNVNLDTITIVLGAVGLESPHAARNRASTTNALMRVISDARATAIPRRLL